MSAEPAIRCDETERTYAQAHERAALIAGGLAALGVGDGDTVAQVLRNSVEFMELTMGISRAGASPVPVNWHWRGDELGYLLADSGAKAVFAHSEFVPVVTAAAPAGVQVIEVPQPGVPRTGQPRLELEVWLAAQEPAATPVGLPRPGVIYTSGTTGRPKGVIREKIDLDQTLNMAGALMERFGLGPGIRTLIPAPMYHAAPNVLASVAAVLGMDVTIMASFDAEQLLALVQRHRIQQIQMVPTMFTRLLRLPEEVRTGYDLSSLTKIVHTAAPCPVGLKRQIIDWLGPIVAEYYGGTETGPVVWCDSTSWLAHPGTVGAPVDDAAIRIVGGDGADVPTGEVGTVYVKPPGWWPAFSYLGDEAKRRAMELAGFVTVGDVGRVDADGFLYLTDRASDMVISGGVNIYPAEIEAALSELAGVRDSAVFGIPDEDFGEALAAHIELEPGASLTEDDVRGYVHRTLAGYKAPKVVVFTAELPREETGKLFKRKLRAPYWADTGRSI
ncbi:MAG TPA: AMP-binding protein [Streptosporangiaceae bacterium]|jgi:long-chain acyl-CoA synthetase|nr:AMP-binding protein [Streptosporangiaceae bacterium]